MKKLMPYFIFLIIALCSFSTLAKDANNCLSSIDSHVINTDTLWLDDCGLTDADVPIIISYLGNNPHITQLYLLNNRIADSGAAMIAKNKTLKMVELRNNMIGSSGILALTHSSIHMIDLQGNLTAPHIMDVAENKKSKLAGLTKHHEQVLILG